MTNAHAELYFRLKKSNDEANNIPLTKYLEKNNEFRIAVQRQFVDGFCEDVYKSENSKSFIKSVTNLKSFYEKIPSTPQTFESDTDNIEGKSIEEETWTPKLSSKSPTLKTSFLKKTNKHLVLDAKKQLKKSRAFLDRKEKSARVNKKKVSSENCNTEQNKSTNIASDDSSDNSCAIIEDTPLEKHEADNRHIDMSLIEES